MGNNLIKEMKERIAKSGSSKKEVLYFAPDSVKRVRFLQELDEGKMVKFHSDYNSHIYELCKDPDGSGNGCDLCDEGIAVLEQYAWSVWDYDSNAVKILLTKATGVSPIPALIELYEEYGTLLDRDLKIKKIGKGVGGSFAVTPLDKSRFRSNAKAFTDKQMDEIFEKAYGTSPDFKSDDEDDVEEEAPKKKKPVKKAKKEKTLRDQYEELDEETLRDICSEIGMSAKEIKALKTADDILDELFDNYEEEDLKDLLDDLDSEEDDE